jgi:hypothetical protein
MRELTLNELQFVTGAGDECEDEDASPEVAGIETNKVGRAAIEIYEGLVEATSHIIERVANAL